MEPDLPSPGLTPESRLPSPALLRRGAELNPVVLMPTSPAAKAWLGQSQVREVVWHGSNNPWREFRLDYSEANNDFGAGIYASNDYGDAAGYDYNREHGAPCVTPLIMRLEHPLRIGGPDETVLHYGRSGKRFTGELGKFMDGLEAVARASGLKAEAIGHVQAAVRAKARGAKGRITAHELHQVLLEQPNLRWLHQESDGAVSAGQLVAEAFRGLGYDGVIDRLPRAKWQEKEGQNHLTDQTTHYIAFSPLQIKAASGNSGQFDPRSADIYA